MAEYIRVNEKAALKELLRALLNASGPVVYLSLPNRSALWEAKPLRLIRRAGIETQKRIVIVTSSRVGQIRAREAGLTVVGEQELLQAKFKSQIGAASDSPAGWLSQKSGQTLASAKGRKPGRRYVFLAALLAMLIGFAASNVMLQKAVVTVYARAETFKSSADFVVDKSLLSPSGQTMPGIAAERTVNITESFAATGEQNGGSPARGNVTFYSAYPATLKFRAATTFLKSSTGLRYRLDQDVGGLRPGAAQTVAVAAEAGGAAGNLPANATLEVHNAAFGFRPQVVYARVSAGGLTGGNDSVAKVVSEKDYALAREKASLMAVAQAEEELRESLAEDVKIINDLSQQTIISEQFDAALGAATPHFAGRFSIRVEALAFDKNLSLDLAAEAARKKVATGKQLLEVKEDTLQYKVRSWDKEKGLAVVDLGFETLLAAKLDTDELAALLSNRSPEEIKNLLLQKPEIASVRIDLSPFWRKKTPKSTNRMQVRVEIKK